MFGKSNFGKSKFADKPTTAVSNGGGGTGTPAPTVRKRRVTSLV